MTIDHLGISVPPENHKTIVDFYLAALKPIGYTQLATYGANGEVVGIGADHDADLWITAVPGASDTMNLHLAFSIPGMYAHHGGSMTELLMATTRSQGSRRLPLCRDRGGRQG
jgi:hypothetical protein